MGLYFMACLDHSIWHTLQHSSMSAGVNSWHYHILHERELLHRQGLIEIFSLYIFSDSVVVDWSTVFFCCTEKHPWSMVVFIIYDIHFVVTEVLFIFLLKLSLASFKDYYIVLLLLFYNLFFNFFFNFFLLQIFVESSFAQIAFKQQVLLILRQVFWVISRVEWGLPLPILTNFDEMITCQFELIGW